MADEKVTKARQSATKSSPDAPKVGSGAPHDAPDSPSEPDSVLNPGNEAGTTAEARGDEGYNSMAREAAARSSDAESGLKVEGDNAGDVGKFLRFHLDANTHVPALVVAEGKDGTVNVRVFHDSHDIAWVTGVAKGDGAGMVS